jgi:hypothetical protein
VTGTTGDERGHAPAAQAPPLRATRRSFLVGGAVTLAAGLGAPLIARTSAPATGGAEGPRLVAASGHGPSWRAPEPWDWGRFREVPVSQIDNKVRLAATGDVGTATGVGGASANDRRFYVLRDVEATDVEVSAEFAAPGEAQCGLALRVQPDRAVVVWRNIFFSANANLINGVWEYDGATLHGTNQSAHALRGFAHPVRYAVGDGTTMTVTTAHAHRLGPMDVVLHEGAVGEFGQVVVESVPGPSTYTFASSAVGLWESGTWRRVTLHARRHAAVRLVGTQVMFKHWLPHEAEPSWDDPERARLGLLPEVLPSGGAPPLGPGGVGLLVSHLGDGRQVEVRNLQVTPLA